MSLTVLRCVDVWLGSGVFARPQSATDEVDLKKLGAGKDARPQPHHTFTRYF